MWNSNTSARRREFASMPRSLDWVGLGVAGCVHADKLTGRRSEGDHIGTGGGIGYSATDTPIPARRGGDKCRAAGRDERVTRASRTSPHGHSDVRSFRTQPLSGSFVHHRDKPSDADCGDAQTRAVHPTSPATPEPRSGTGGGHSTPGTDGRGCRTGRGEQGRYPSPRENTLFLPGREFGPEDGLGDVRPREQSQHCPR